MYKSSIELIRHIEREANFIIKSAGIKKEEEFYADETLKRAVSRALEIIGEASIKLNEEFKIKHPEIQWVNLRGMRNRLIHDYEGTDYTIVWSTIQDDIPELYFQVTELLKNNTDDTL
jgi:uncharacterized protein with HEPN domain